jgi:hypothetical protein
MRTLGRWYAGFATIFPECDLISYVNPDVLREAWEQVAAEIRDLGRPAHLLVSGDICTWPYKAPAVHAAYELFTRPGNSYQGRTIGLPSDVGERLILLLGNHDTFGHHRDGTYRSSPFHTKYGVAAGARVQPVNVGGRWVVYFLARTDWSPCWGWLGGEGRTSGFPRWLRLLRDEHRRAAEGQSRAINDDHECSAEAYRSAVKLLVLHHSPLEYDYYQGGMSRLRYELTKLTERQWIPQFCHDVGISGVLFGHSHDPKDSIVDGTLYLDAGTISAVSVSQLVTERETNRPVAEYAYQVYDFIGDDVLGVRTFRMLPPTWEFTPMGHRYYRLVAGSVSELSM